MQPLTLPRRWTWPGVFAVEQLEVRSDEWILLQLAHQGARLVDWRPARPGWSRWWYVSDGAAWVEGAPLEPRRWHPVPFGRPCVTSHLARTSMLVSRRPLPAALTRADPATEAGLRRLFGRLAAPDEATRALATQVAALTGRLETSPTSAELSATLQLDERRTSEAAARYFSRFHATVAGWRDYLRWLRLELALTAFSARRSTVDVARWLGFRSANALLHSLQKSGLPTPGALRACEAAPHPEAALCALLGPEKEHSRR